MRPPHTLQQCQIRTHPPHRREQTHIDPKPLRPPHSRHQTQICHADFIANGVPPRNALRDALIRRQPVGDQLLRPPRARGRFLGASARRERADALEDAQVRGRLRVASDDVR